jgi:hypothetical protein
MIAFLKGSLRGNLESSRTPVCISMFGADTVEMLDVILL